MSYIVSGAHLIPAPTAAVGVNGPMVFADPDFDLTVSQTQAETKRFIADIQLKSQLRSSVRSLQLGKVQRLPGTALEAEATRPHLERYAGSKPHVYTGANALEGIFKAFARPKVAVLSTHGFFQDDQSSAFNADGSNLGENELARTSDGQKMENPLLRCGLLFSGCNRRAEVSDPTQDDGVLTGLEIVSADMRGTEMVVLSACETGLGQVRNGEGVAGLRQAFQLAGVQTVVATLWQISDLETARLMSEFFGNLADGHAKVDALRNAQLKRMQARRDAQGGSHPFFWAPFTLTGR